MGEHLYAAGGDEHAGGEGSSLDKEGNSRHFGGMSDLRRNETVGLQLTPPVLGNASLLFPAHLFRPLEDALNLQGGDLPPQNYFLVHHARFALESDCADHHKIYQIFEGGGAC